MQLIKSLVAPTLVVGIMIVSLGLAWPVSQGTAGKVVDSPVASNVLAAAATLSDTATENDEFEPVDDMHHFMEYVCEPSYKALKEIMLKAPADRRAWKPFKNHALVLAETSALVSARGPEDPEKAKQWKQIALGVYKTGKALYKSAGDFEEATKQYGLMIDNCNQCHTVFAKGKHQLKK